MQKRLTRESATEYIQSTIGIDGAVGPVQNSRSLMATSTACLGKSDIEG